MPTESASLFDVLVSRGAVSPDDVQLRAQIARAEAVSNAIAAAERFLARLAGTIVSRSTRRGAAARPRIGSRPLARAGVVRRPSANTSANTSEAPRNVA